VALVTGGNRGIGRGIALALAEAGADLVIAARDEARATEVAREIAALGRRAAAVRCDVTVDADIASAIEAARGLGGLDILVNNAGVASGGPPAEIDEATWDLVVDTNLKASFRVAQAAYPLFIEGGRGKLINIGSEYSLFGSAGALPYSASKGGVIQLTKSLAVAWARDHIEVNAIIPGWIRTDMTAGVQTNERMFQRIIERTPARRFGEPEEVGGAAVFLASSASDFVTGVAIPVDGGYAAA
jgi:2-deoxy-D-gluconate 3-dehydrogenase